MIRREIVLLLMILSLGMTGTSYAQATCGPIDFVLILDDTFSMSDAIANIQGEIVDLVATLEERSGNDLRVALVTFKDRNEVEIDLPFTNQTSSFSTELGAVTASGGVGVPEASDVALATVVDGSFGFRSSSTKIVVLVTDAPPGGTGVDDRFDTDDELRAAQLAQTAADSGIRLTAVLLPRVNYEVAATRTIMERYATVTDGIYREVGTDGTGTGAAILDSVESCGGGCSRTRREKVLCTTDGSGDFTFDFIFFNQSDDEVHHLFLLNPPPGVTFSPNHFQFSPPVLPGRARRIPEPIRIQNAQPGQTISFIMTLHDEFIDQCCSVHLVLELPECDCGQVLSENRPHCSIFGPASNPRQDRFVFQNLFGETPVEHVLLIPISPADLELVPNHFDLRDHPLGFGDEIELSTRLVGGQPGDLVCYRASTHDGLFRNCCSIERCVRLPNCDFPHDFSSGEGIETTVFDRGLLIEGFPSPPGEPEGIVIDTSGATDFDVEWSPLDMTALSEGSLLRHRFIAPVDGSLKEPVGVLEAVRVPDGIELRSRFPAIQATRQTIELYRYGRLVERITDVPVEEPIAPVLNAIGGPAVVTDAHFTYLGTFSLDGIPQGVPASQESSRSCDPLERLPGERPCLFQGYTFKETLPWAFSLFSLAFADEVRFIPEDGEGEIGPLSQVELQGSGIDSLLVETLDVDFDCNRNGSPDYDDIDLGVSLDLDHDGRPDECDRTVALNTGFDEASGSLLAAGAVDDDWRVTTVDAAARVIEMPNANWVDPLPDSQWISVEASEGTSIPDTLFLDFERCFCLASGSRPVTLTAALFADDRATISLNGALLGGPGGGFLGPDPLEVEVTGTVGDGLFVEGENCLVVEVEDAGRVVTGLDLAGTVVSGNGFCPDPKQP